MPLLVVHIKFHVIASRIGCDETHEVVVGKLLPTFCWRICLGCSSRSSFMKNPVHLEYKRHGFGCVTRKVVWFSKSAICVLNLVSSAFSEDKLP